MKNYYQTIEEGISKEGEILPKRRIPHEKPMTAFESKMFKFRSYLSKKYNVLSISNVAKKERVKARIEAKLFAKLPLTKKEKLLA